MKKINYHGFLENIILKELKKIPLNEKEQKYINKLILEISEGVHNEL